MPAGGSICLDECLADIMEVQVIIARVLNVAIIKQ